MPTKKTNIVRVNIATIHLNDKQQRLTYDENQIAELADSIRDVGLINPITLRQTGDSYTLIAGSCRLRACQLLRREYIEARILTNSTDDDLSIMAHENLFRQAVSPVDEAHFFSRLIESDNYTPLELAHLANKSESYVHTRLALLDLDIYLRDAVHSETLSISHALELSKFDDPQVREQYTQYAISTGASLQTLRYWRQQFEANKYVPQTSDQLPTRVQQPGQITVFGWYCFSCENFHPAPDMQTIHICQPCFIDLQKAKLTP